MAVQYRKRRKHTIELKRASSRRTGRKAACKTESLGNLMVREDSRQALKEQSRVLKSRKNAPVVVGTKGLVRRKLVSRDGTIYPLRNAITITVRHTAKSFEATIHNQLFKSLLGKGNTQKRAMDAFMEAFHKLVDLHHRKPPHLQTEKDRQINCGLDHLIDWDQFETENPLEKPLVGRIDEHDGEGNIQIFWLIGPGEESAQESTISASEVAEEFSHIGNGGWFYAAGRVFLDRIEWTSRPVEIPDPHDEAAIKTAWDLIPSHVMSDLAAWPLKK